MRLLEALAAIGPLLEPSGKPISDLGARLSGKRVGLCMRRKKHRTVSAAREKPSMTRARRAVRRFLRRMVSHVHTLRAHPHGLS